MRAAAALFAFAVLVGCSAPTQAGSDIADLRAEVQSLTDSVSALNAKLDRVCALIHEATDERSTYYPPGSECN